MSQTYNLLGVHVSVVNLDLAYKAILDWIVQKQKKYVCVAPVSTIVDCQKDSEYKFIVNNASMVTPDGMPVVWMGRLSGYKNIERTYGPDLMRKTCDYGQQEGLKHFFYGGTDEVNQKLVKSLKTAYPEIQIVGMYAPPLLKINEIESPLIMNVINQAHPDILWIGLGSPKQDYWMRNHRDSLEVPVMVGVGAAFDFLAGIKKQAPRWMQKYGLEWLFRLLSEPKRLWRRYLIGNTLFIYYLIKDLIKGLFKRND